MLAHELLQEQLLNDRRREIGALGVREQRAELPYAAQSVKALWPLFTHRLFGIPAPARPAAGC